MFIIIVLFNSSNKMAERKINQWRSNNKENYYRIIND